MADSQIDFYLDLIKEAEGNTKLVEMLMEKIKKVEEKEKEIENHPINRAKNKIKWLKEETKRLFPDIDLNKVEVLWDINSSTLAGQHHRTSSYHKIRYNKAFLVANPDAFVEETIPHEWAHMIVSEVIGRKRNISHGRDWKTICMVLGMKEITRTHNYNLPKDYQSRKQERFAYHCKCRTYNLSKIRHNRQQKGNTYSCRLCRGVLKLIE